MKVTIYTCKAEGELEPPKDARAFVTEWQAVRYGEKRYLDNGKNFILVSARYTGYGWQQFFYGIPFWVEMFIKGF